MFPNEIVDGVITLTHRKDESYFEYISRVSTSKLAKKVKIADLLHNLDITRIKRTYKTRLSKAREVQGSDFISCDALVLWYKTYENERTYF